jgi:protein SCO1/2
LVTEKDGWIDRVQVVSNAPATVAKEPEPAPSFSVLPNVPELKVGDVVPDYTYTNELGRVVKLSEFRGKVVALTFIFTRCPFPTFCPRMTDHFKSVQKTLLADPSAPKNWQLLSVSFDPAFDTSATLRAYGKARGYDPERWSLVSGDMTQVASLAQHFGLYFARNAVPTGQNHNLRTVVLDASGKVRAILIGNDWTPEELIQEIVSAAKP